ncbi:unnamed protein product [Phaeothamnion confervicola]
MPVDQCNENYAFFGLTVVRYRVNDDLGAVMSLLTLSPIIIGVGYFTLMGFRRDLQTFCLAFGQLLDLVLNKVMKTAIAAPRPDLGSCPNTGHGMPSNHAQFMFFFCTFCLLHIWLRTSWSRLEILLASAALLGWGPAVAYSRIHLTCHSLEQVAAGSALGSATGALWFVFEDAVLRPLCPRVASWRVCEALHAKDYSAVRHVLRHEREAVHGAAGRSHQKRE